MFNFRIYLTTVAVLSSGLIMTSKAIAATTVRVTVENLSPTNGTFVTPVWVGFHNGGFDLYNRGEAASVALERLAEDGNVTPISNAFSASGAGTVQGSVRGGSIPQIAPKEISSAIFTLDETAASSRYFSYASMVVPSNDAFFANDNPLEHEIFDAKGNFIGADFIELGSDILDAGTEVNDEIPSNTAFFGQTIPNTGTDQNGTVQIHPGFIPNGPILSTPAFANADFKVSGYQLVRIRVESVPEPLTILGSLTALGLGASLKRRLK